MIITGIDITNDSLINYNISCCVVTYIGSVNSLPKKEKNAIQYTNIKKKIVFLVSFCQTLIF